MDRTSGERGSLQVTPAFLIVVVGSSKEKEGLCGWDLRDFVHTGKVIVSRSSGGEKSVTLRQANKQRVPKIPVPTFLCGYQRRNVVEINIYHR